MFQSVTCVPREYVRTPLMWVNDLSRCYDCTSVKVFALIGPTTGGAGADKCAFRCSLYESSSDSLLSLATSGEGLSIIGSYPWMSIRLSSESAETEAIFPSMSQNQVKSRQEYSCNYIACMGNEIKSNLNFRRSLGIHRLHESFLYTYIRYRLHWTWERESLPSQRTKYILQTPFSPPSLKTEE